MLASPLSLGGCRYAPRANNVRPYNLNKKAHTRKIFACAFFVLLYFSHRPAEQVGGGAVMGDEDRGALPRQPFCGGDSVLDKLGIHAGEGLVQQERFRIAAEQRAQQSGTALLPGEVYTGFPPLDG